MAHSRNSRSRRRPYGTSWIKVSAVLLTLVGAAAGTIFVINGNFDPKAWLNALTNKDGDKPETSTADEEPGIARLDSSPEDKAQADPFADGSATAEAQSTSDAANPFESTDADSGVKKIAPHKHLRHVAQRDEAEVPRIEWEEGTQKPSRKIAAHPVSTKRDRPGSASLDDLETPSQTTKLTSARSLEEELTSPPDELDSPRLKPKHKPIAKHPAAQRDELNDETPPELSDDKVSRHRHGGPPTSGNEMYGQLTSPYEAKKNANAPGAESPNDSQEFAEAPPKGLKHKHHHPASDEPAETSDEQDPFANVRQVKDERIATKPDADPVLDSADLETATLAAPDTDIDLAKVRKLTADGDERGAHRLLSEWYWKHPTHRKVFQKDLEELAKRIYFSPQPYYGTPYEIQPGDQLAKIAKQHHVSWQYLAKLNQVQPKKLRVGKKLKVFEGPFQACVDLSDFELTVHHNGLYIKKYKVGIGKENSSPIGEFAVREKLENPTYYGPDGDVKEANDPLNPLGERWIDIGNSFGIHGTIEPDTVGKSASKGCIRMLNSDIEEVYDLLTTGSMVRIQR